MKLLKILVVASLIGIGIIQARDYLTVPPPRPSHASRIPGIGRRIAEKIIDPVAARADRGGRFHWR